MKTRFVAGACALAVASSAHAGFVYTHTPGFTDQDFLALTDGGSLEHAVGESRIGNAQTNGTWEVAMWELGGQGTPKDEDQRNQANGQEVDFALSWDGVDTVTFNVGQASVSWNQVAGSFTDIFFRLRAGNSSTVELKQLAINGQAYGSSLIADPSDTLEYLRVQNMGGGPLPAFSITGIQQLSWTGTRPNNSGLAYQIKMTNVIPTPGSVAIGTLAFAACVRRRRA